MNNQIVDQKELHRMQEAETTPEFEEGVRMASQPEELVKEECPKENLVVFHCPFDGLLPKVFIGPTDFDLVKKPYAYCSRNMCIASHYAVPLEVWNERGPLETLVKHIPSDEPIFVLRAQDKYSVRAIREWLIVAIRNEQVSNEKIQKANTHCEELENWQEANPEKVKEPD